MCTVHSRRNLAAIHGLALAPSGRGLIAARGDTSGTKWGTTERDSMLIRAPQNRAGVLWSPVSTLLFHLSFENLKSEESSGITKYYILAPCTIFWKFSSNSRSLELPDSLSRSGHEEEVVGGTQQDLSLSHWWPQEGGEVGGREVAVVEA